MGVEATERPSDRATERPSDRATDPAIDAWAWRRPRSLRSLRPSRDDDDTTYRIRPPSQTHRTGQPASTARPSCPAGRWPGHVSSVMARYRTFWWKETVGGSIERKTTKRLFDNPSLRVRAIRRLFLPDLISLETTTMDFKTSFKGGETPRGPKMPRRVRGEINEPINHD